MLRRVDNLCDTCRQNQAVRRFIESNHPSGQAVERQLCIGCPYPIFDYTLAELSKHILDGKCEKCGGQAYSIFGIPGPDHLVLCRSCEAQFAPNRIDPPSRDLLCDTCRQQIAVRHFRDDERKERHLCSSCPYPISDWEFVELNQQILLHGKCEKCGAAAFSAPGMPGPSRRVLCVNCAENYKYFTPE